MKKLFIFMLLCASTTAVFGQNKKKPFREKDVTGRVLKNMFIAMDTFNVYYELVSNFELDEDGTQNFNEVRQDNLSKDNKMIPSSMANQWLVLYLYKGKHFLYCPSEFGNNYRIMIDTYGVFVEYLIDRKRSSLITDFQRKNEKKFSFSVIIEDQKVPFEAEFRNKEHSLMLLKNLENNTCMLLTNIQSLHHHSLLFIDDESNKIEEFAFETEKCD